MTQGGGRGGLLGLGDRAVDGLCTKADLSGDRPKFVDGNGPCVVRSFDFGGTLEDAIRLNLREERQVRRSVEH